MKIKNRKAVTLIEVLVASLILTISICGVLMSLVYSLRINKANAVRYNAQSIARSKLDQINNCANLAETDSLLNNAQSTFQDTSNFTNSTYAINYSLVEVPINEFKLPYHGSAIPKLMALKAEVSSNGERFSTISYVLNSFR